MFSKDVYRLTLYGNFKCITKEAELLYHWLIPGTATATSVIAICNKIRQCALSFMTYRKHEYVPASATMMVCALSLSNKLQPT
ncbi:hypothetical protein HU200_003195 [Digitaria exilis]|uniref:Uncharacterized protein n=1 Tax=Digitaria exilis TaxID=1010633 RepID=A0A835FWF0_9POAL|nr:hypothetical protein HU200_003195 [Digitaria exilis]